jgi:hypothetical protein
MTYPVLNCTKVIKACYSGGQSKIECMPLSCTFWFAEMGSIATGILRHGPLWKVGQIECWPKLSKEASAAQTDAQKNKRRLGGKTNFFLSLKSWMEVLPTCTLLACRFCSVFLFYGENPAVQLWRFAQVGGLIHYSLQSHIFN